MSAERWRQTQELYHAAQARPAMARAAFLEEACAGDDALRQEIESLLAQPVSTDSGRVEISVRPFPAVNSGRWLVSTAGGTRPLWAPSGQELFYVASTGALMRVGVERAPS